MMWFPFQRRMMQVRLQPHTIGQSRLLAGVLLAFAAGCAPIPGGDPRVEQTEAFDQAVEGALNTVIAQLQNATKGKAKAVVAVLDFPIVNGGINPSITNEVTATINTRLGATKGVSTVEREQIAQLIKERGYQQGLEGATEAAVARFGKELRADAVLVGTIMPSGGGYVNVRMRLVAVWSAEVIGAAQTRAVAPPGY